MQGADAADVAQELQEVGREHRLSNPPLPQRKPETNVAPANAAAAANNNPNPLIYAIAN